MFWKVIATLGAGSFVLGGLDIASTPGCDQVDFGGSGRSSTYTCTFGTYQGDLSAGAASTLMIVGGLALIVFLWAGVFRRSNRDF